MPEIFFLITVLEEIVLLRLWQHQILRLNLLFFTDIVPPKVLVKDFMESLKKKSKNSAIEIHSSSSDSESE